MTRPQCSNGLAAMHPGVPPGTANQTSFAVLIGLSALIVSTIHAQAAPAPKADSVETVEAVTLAQPVVFEVTSSTGSLKETVQKAQQLTWRRYDRPNEPKFQVTNIAVAFLRSEPTGEVKMTFSGKISSSGFSTVDEVKLNVIVRTKGGASIYSWSPVITAKCGDKNQPLVPLTDKVPNDIAANVFANVGSVEIGEYRDPDFPRVKVRSCHGARARSEAPRQADVPGDCVGGADSFSRDVGG